MRRILILAVSFLIGLFFVNNCFADEKIARDLVEYINQGILRIGEIETKSLEKYSSVIGENYTTDELVYTTLKDDVIPLYKRFYEALRQISPKTETVMKLHSIYVRGVRDINEGFNLKRLGLELKNDDIVLTANKKIEAGSEDVREWKRQLVELCKKHGVGSKESEKQK